MKKVIVCLVFGLALFTSCKKENTQKNDTPKKEIAKAQTYSVDTNATEVNWTAYKTTAKKPVKGVFTQLNINTPVISETKHGAFANLGFEIPVASFFSNDETRDSKIKRLFFGIMKETTLISGTFSDIIGNENKGTMSLNLKMNGETVAIPMIYTIDGKIVTLDGNIKNLMDWKMDDAFKSLHKACELLHTGEDGISKTWEDVAINATAVLKS